MTLQRLSGFLLFGLFFALSPSYAFFRFDHVDDFGRYGFWGSWGSKEWCPEGSFAYGFWLRTEAMLGGSDDDTALNGVALACSNLNLEYTASIESSYGPWGTWSTFRYCYSTFLTAADAKLESHQGSSDDTALNNVNFKCEHNYDLLGPGGPWGSWQGLQRCPSHSVICGIETRLEAPQGSGDDTALNGVWFYCCSKHIGPLNYPDHFPVRPNPYDWRPTFLFDGKHECYPSDALNRHNNWCRGFDSHADVYYEEHDCGSGEYRLSYWLFYGYQNGCFLGFGSHDLDWEHVTLNFKFADWTWEIDSVVFVQHGGWYTRHYPHDTRQSVRVYVGKIGHGNYHNSCCGGGCDTYCHGGCQYFHDFRNPGITWKPTHVWPIYVAVDEGGAVGNKIGGHHMRNPCGRKPCDDSGCSRNNWEMTF